MQHPFSAENTIACRHTGKDIEATGKTGGAYVGKAYNPTIKTICKANDFELRSVGTRYEILWDGEVLNRYPNLKTAETFFIDFADLTRGKYNKLKAA
jgi:hypothetical protein